MGAKLHDGPRGVTLLSPCDKYARHSVVARSLEDEPPTVDMMPVLPHVILLPDASWRMLPAAKRACGAISLLLHSRAFDFHTTAIAALRPHRGAPLSFLTSSRLRHFLPDQAPTFEHIFMVCTSPVTIKVKQRIRSVTILMRQCGGMMGYNNRIRRHRSCDF
jgi:hypothetical protein